MEKFDILAQENEALEHFNTGWLWMRRGEIVANAWRAVLMADLHIQSRDQVFFNEVSCRMFSRSTDRKPPTAHGPFLSPEHRFWVRGSYERASTQPSAAYEPTLRRATG